MLARRDAVGQIRAVGRCRLPRPSRNRRQRRDRGRANACVRQQRDFRRGRHQRQYADIFGHVERRARRSAVARCAPRYPVPRTARSACENVPRRLSTPRAIERDGLRRDRHSAGTLVMNHRPRRRRISAMSAHTWRSASARRACRPARRCAILSASRPKAPSATAKARATCAPFAPDISFMRATNTGPARLTRRLARTVEMISRFRRWRCKLVRESFDRGRRKIARKLGSKCGSSGSSLANDLGLEIELGIGEQHGEFGPRQALAVLRPAAAVRRRRAGTRRRGRAGRARSRSRM